jgi:hypothetical protein
VEVGVEVEVWTKNQTVSRTGTTTGATDVRKESRWSSGNDRRDEVRRDDRTDRGSYGNGPPISNNNRRESNNNRGRQDGKASDIFTEGSVYKGV